MLAKNLGAFALVCGLLLYAQSARADYNPNYLQTITTNPCLVETQSGGAANISGAAQLGNGGNVITGTAYTVALADVCTDLRFTGTAPATITLPSTATPGFGYGAGIGFVNDSTVTETISIGTPSLFHGASTFVIPASTQCTLVSDGTNYYPDVGCTALTPGAAAATSSTLGLTRPDNVTTTVAGGVISAVSPPIATSSAVGLVKPDNVTTTVNSAGALTVVGGGGGGSTSPGGSSGQFQWNNGGAFAGLPSLTTAGGDIILTDASATALTIGPNGQTNPILRVNTAAASAAVGVQLTGGASGSGVTLQVITPGTNDGFTLGMAGTGTFAVQTSGTTRFSVSPSELLLQPAAITSGSTPHLQYSGTADTIGAGLNAHSWVINTGAGGYRAWVGGTTVSLYEDLYFAGANLQATSPTTITEAALVSLLGETAGTNISVGTLDSLLIKSVAVGVGVTNAYAIHLYAPTGATNNYALEATGDIDTTTGRRTNGVLVESATAPTLSSGFGTGDTIVAPAGVGAFQDTVGSSPGTSLTITMPAAHTRWVCPAFDLTTPTVLLRPIISSPATTSIAFTASAAPTAGDVIVITCKGF